MSTAEEDLKTLIQKIETIIPYVTPTIDPRGGNVFKIERMIGAHDPTNTKDWVAVHAGRAGSSTRQLESLLKLAREMADKPKTAEKTATLKIKTIQVLVHRTGCDIISIHLDAPTPFPKVGDPAFVKIDAARGHGVEWLKKALGLDPDEVTDMTGMGL